MHVTLWVVRKADAAVVDWTLLGSDTRAAVELLLGRPPAAEWDEGGDPAASWLVSPAELSDVIAPRYGDAPDRQFLSDELALSLVVGPYA